MNVASGTPSPSPPGSGWVAWGVMLGVVAAIAFALLFAGGCVGPANAPMPCPVRCADGLCCAASQSCVAGGKCRDEFPASSARDAGAD